MERSLIKRPIMTVPYGVTDQGMADKIKDQHRGVIKKSKMTELHLYKFNPQFKDIPESYINNGYLILSNKEIYE
jgi:hypothetical protein